MSVTQTHFFFFFSEAQTKVGTFELVVLEVLRNETSGGIPGKKEKNKTKQLQLFVNC